MASDAALTRLPLLHRVEDGNIVFVQFVRMATGADLLGIDRVGHRGVLIVVIGAFEATVEGGFVVVRLACHDVDVKSMGFFDVSNGVAEVAAHRVGVRFVVGIGTGFAGDDRFEIVAHRHVAGGTVVLFGTDFVGDLTVQGIFEIAQGVGRVLKLIDDLFVTLSARMVVWIFGRSRSEKQKKGNENGEREFHGRDTLMIYGSDCDNRLNRSPSPRMGRKVK